MRDFTDYIFNIHLYYQGRTNSAYFNILFISNLPTVILLHHYSFPLLYRDDPTSWRSYTMKQLQRVAVTPLHRISLTSCWCITVSLLHRYNVQNYTMTLLQCVAVTLWRSYAMALLHRK